MVNVNCFVILTVCLFVNYSNGSEKKCRYATGTGASILEDRSLWNLQTGFYCYYFLVKGHHLKFKYTFKRIPYNNSYIVVTPINESYFWYDVLNETSLYYLKPSFTNDVFFEKWKICAQEALDCCDYSMNEKNIYPTVEYPCPALWDSWSCFAPAKANTVEKVPCTVWSYSSETPSCELQSEKECFPNRTWAEKTNYEICALAPLLRSRHYFFVTVLAVSACLSFPAVVIFVCFRAFRQNPRFILHRNLILAIIVRNIFTIMSKEIVLFDELLSDEKKSGIMEDNGVGCRVLAFFENVAKDGMFAWMLAEAYFLHHSIVRPFAREPSLWMIYLAVSILSCLPSLIWALARSLHHAENCWMVDDTQDYWISDGFRFAILGLNLLLLFDIIRVMVSKLKRDGVSQQTKTTVRVTAFLIPLFGFHILVISNRSIVPDKSCAAQDIYTYVSYFIEVLQGVMVAILFCYINSEVHREMKNALRKCVLYLQQRFNINFGPGESLKGRSTMNTGVEYISEGIN